MITKSKTNRSQETKRLSANIRHSKDGMSLLILDISTGEDNMIVFCQEPYFNPKNGTIEGLTTGLQCSSSSAKPRTAIISKNVNMCFCSQYSSADVTTTIGKIEGKTTYFCSVYVDILIHKLPDELIKLMNFRTSAEIILCIDSNSHSILWNSPTNNS